MKLPFRFSIVGVTASLFLATLPVLSTPAGAVMGGEPATGESAVVPLWIRKATGNSACSGVLWRPRLVLTSAHCVTERGASTPISPAQVRVGLPGSTRGDGSPLVNPTAILQPSDFVNGEVVQPQDFAILTLAADLAGSDVIRLATFGEVDAWAAARALVEIVGYGRVGPEAGTDSAHRVANPVARSYSWGSSRWVELVATAERGSCPGDSGGGYFVRQPSGERLLVAIHAGGWSPCGGPSPSGLFSSTGILPMSYPGLVEQALSLAGYPQIPSAPSLARAVSVGETRTAVEWSPPERHPDAVVSYSVVAPDGAILCSVPASSTSCDVAPGVIPGTPLQVRAANALGEIASFLIIAQGAPVRRLDVSSRPPLEPGAAHELRVCQPKPGALRLAERLNSRWVPIGRATTESRPDVCPANRPHLAVFAWRAPSAAPKDGIAMRLSTPGARPIDYLVKIRKP